MEENLAWTELKTEHIIQISGDLRTVTPMEECLSLSTATAGETIQLL